MGGDRGDFLRYQSLPDGYSVVPRPQGDFGGRGCWEAAGRAVLCNSVSYTEPSWPDDVCGFTGTPSRKEGLDSFHNVSGMHVARILHASASLIKPRGEKATERLRENERREGGLGVQGQPGLNSKILSCKEEESGAGEEGRGRR